MLAIQNPSLFEVAAAIAAKDIAKSIHKETHVSKLIPTLKIVIYSTKNLSIISIEIIFNLQLHVLQFGHFTLMNGQPHSAHWSLFT